jgi:hypothetical protein
MHPQFTLALKALTISESLYLCFFSNFFAVGIAIAKLKDKYYLIEGG